MNDFDECFRTGDERRTVAEALRKFNATLTPMTGIERVGTRDALNRILAEDLVASADIPPYDNSAVDGYAVWFDDLATNGETRLPVAARVAAGHPLAEPIAPGRAVQIFTGASMPRGIDGTGPDTVFMIEDCRIDSGTVVVPGGIRRGANLRRAGEDVRNGDIVLKPGARLRPQDVGMAASLGFAEIAVYRRLRVAVFSTGDEVREPGVTLNPGSIFDTNRYALMSMLERLGCTVSDLGIFPDDAERIRGAIGQAAGAHDLLLTSGGVSRGEEDHVRSAVAALGAVNFWNLAIKPGRSIALGHVRASGRLAPFIGLPGNPVAVMVTFLLIARPILMRLAGAADTIPAAFKVSAGFDFKKKPGRREWLRSSLVRSEQGLIVDKFPEDGSGILTSMVATDGLVELSEDNTGVQRGDLVDFLPYSELMG